MLSLLLLSLCAACCASALFWLRTRRARALLAHLPTYPRLPFIGNTHQIFGNGEHLYGVLEALSDMLECHNMPFAVWIGPRPVIIVSDHEDVKAITNTFLDKPYYYSFAKEWVGNGLVTAPGEIWKRSIKKFAGIFTTTIVDGYQDVFNAQAAKLLSRLKVEVGAQPFDVLNKYLSYTTLESICQTALGVPRISDRIVTTEFYAAFIRVFELMLKRGMNLLLHPDCIYQLTPGYKEFKSCVAVLHNASETIMAKRKKERAELKKKGTNCSEHGEMKFKSFLDILLDLSETDSFLTDEQIRYEIQTIIVGGQETAAFTLFMSLLMLGRNPDIQDKLYAEIKEIFGDSKRPVDKDDLSRLRYCEAVVLEILRMYPAIPFVMRDADRDLKLKSCTIPKGTGCGLHLLAAGRSKRAWGSDADQYRPERWLEEGGCPGYPTSFLAFSYGRRSCIGRKYAIPLMKTILVHCVRELVITSEGKDLRLKLDVILKPVSGHLIQVHLREKN